MSKYYILSNTVEQKWCSGTQLQNTIADMLNSNPDMRLSVETATQQEYFHHCAQAEILTNQYTPVQDLTTKSGLPILYVKFGLNDEDATCKFIVLVKGFMEIHRTTNAALMEGEVL